MNARRGGALRFHARGGFLIAGVGRTTGFANHQAMTTTLFSPWRLVRVRVVARRLVAAALLISLSLVPPLALAGYRENLQITSIEIALLPKFCWAQFEVPGAQGDEFTIRDCGPLANHYCPGLLYLIRGKGPAAKGKPLPFFRVADENVAYTEKGIAGYPNCSIREHVEATRVEVNHLLRMYGSKPAAAH